MECVGTPAGRRRCLASGALVTTAGTLRAMRCAQPSHDADHHRTGCVLAAGQRGSRAVPRITCHVPSVGWRLAAPATQRRWQARGNTAARLLAAMQAAAILAPGASTYARPSPPAPLLSSCLPVPCRARPQRLVDTVKEKIEAKLKRAPKRTYLSAQDIDARVQVRAAPRPGPLVHLRTHATRTHVPARPFVLYALTSALFCCDFFHSTSPHTHATLAARRPLAARAGHGVPGVHVVAVAAR
jgi:hypothetical protein